MSQTTMAPRLRRLPTAVVLGRQVPVATGRRARLLGLGRLNRDEAGAGLLIPCCSSVHTFGMRFALDLVFLDGERRPISVRWGISPRRAASDPRASAVLELPSSQSPASRGRVLAARFLEE
jgi:uncharacterized protein